MRKPSALPPQRPGAVRTPRVARSRAMRSLHGRAHAATASYSACIRSSAMADRPVIEHHAALAHAQDAVGVAPRQHRLMQHADHRQSAFGREMRRSSRITSSEASGSRLATGSSASSAAGRCASARAIEARCAWPPDSVPARWAAKSARPTSLQARHGVRLFRARQHAERGGEGPVPAEGAAQHVGQHAAPGDQPGLLEHHAHGDPRIGQGAAGQPVMSRPATQHVPGGRAQQPGDAFRSSVDLPQPLWPRTASSSPAATDEAGAIAAPAGRFGSACRGRRPRSTPRVIQVFSFFEVDVQHLDQVADAGRTRHRSAAPGGCR